MIFAGVRGDVERLYQAMDVFVLPSLYEGLGMVLIEAQTSGLPCVFTATIPQEADVTELVTRLSLSDRPEKWADAAIEASQTERRSYADEVAAAGYDIHVVAHDLEQYYVDLIEKGTGEA